MESLARPLRVEEMSSVGNRDSTIDNCDLLILSREACLRYKRVNLSAKAWYSLILVQLVDRRSNRYLDFRRLSSWHAWSDDLCLFAYTWWTEEAQIGRSPAGLNIC